jgi:hypothetical protein
MNTTSLQRYETRIARSTFTNIHLQLFKNTVGLTAQKQDIIHLGYVNGLGSFEEI